MAGLNATPILTTLRTALAAQQRDPTDRLTVDRLTATACALRDDLDAAEAWLKTEQDEIDAEWNRIEFAAGWLAARQTLPDYAQREARLVAWDEAYEAQLKIYEQRCKEADEMREVLAQAKRVIQTPLSQAACMPAQRAVESATGNAPTRQATIAGV